ncbi:hypothetical protein [Amycolatopsis taiwanensis]|uniref:Uncharacterized protein n=1 Tax=Amycolatopsis taiwanensis TaxID=342230 RepID=A0A9W6R8X4_9PSEU|nr:hypothetical protein [Amycolatopsis taiwanensis]GLY70440.1 hypothetical protein Atai01_70590 [Amycolatopsis taiwanensis]
MRKTFVIAAAAVAITAGGATALASASHTGTDDTPRISQVVPGPATSATIERHGGLDDGPNHDVGDDRSTTRIPPQPHQTYPAAPAPTTERHGGFDDGPNHDIGDDHGGQRHTGSGSERHGGSDDGPNHDLGDDHGGRR